ncbi:ATP-binding response regulator [Salinigranum rubrum]|nr:HAMP domain-containing sensor histidine kinase [Salinigranum rubrum]
MLHDDSLRLLLIEDNPGDARYIREMLRDVTELTERVLDRGEPEGAEFDHSDPVAPPELIHEDRLSSGLERLEEGGIDAVLLDLNLPDSERLDTLTALRRATDSVPIIVLTGMRDRETGMEAFHRGADEYLVKDQLNRDLLIRSIYHAMVHKRDERELKRQRDQLRAKTERLDEFAALVAHDLRNPLAVAAGELELSRRTGDDRLDNVTEALERMDDLIEKLLRLARNGTHVENPQPVDVETEAQNAWAYVETGDATLELGDFSRGQEIAADPTRLKQLLENLFRNALEQGSSDVTVRVGPLLDGFYVEDTGPGIPADDRSRVFEAGYTTNPSGTGLGLSIVQDIAHAHGWEVTVTDGDDGGARFEFTGVERR